MSARIGFFGYGDLALAGIEVLAKCGATPVVVVIPGNREGAEVEAVRQLAARHAIPALAQPGRAAVARFASSLRQVELDLIVVWSYSMRLPAEVLSIPSRGAVNVHGGLLPQYRGAHVTQWALINGEPEWGVTLHYMTEEVDRGPVIADRRFPLDDTDDALTVRDKMRIAGAELLRRWWPALAAGTAPRAAQDETQARYWPFRSVEDGRLHWSMSADSLCRTVRALRANTPGAFLDLAGHRLSIRRAAAGAPLIAGAAAGRIVAIDGSAVRVATSTDDVLVLSADIDDGPADLRDVAALMTRGGCVA